MGANDRQPSTGSGTARSAIDVKTLLVTLAVAATLLLAYAVGSSQRSPSTSAATEGAAAADTSSGSAATDADQQQATIVMTGTGKAIGVPDQMTFQVEVEATSSDVSSALAQVSRTANKVLHRLRDNDVPRKNVKTNGLSIHPDYDYSGGRAVIVGYSASEHMVVAIDDLSAAGRVLGATADAGGNAVRINGIRLSISDTDALLQQARRDAVKDATTKADEYAAAAGRALGEVVSIREVTQGSSIRPVPQALEKLSAADGTVVPIRPGRSALQVTVAVVWTFAD
ncbi:MAG TPA: SIMPL domain-containing protein [Nocardioidaceae bacterium]|jgi:hypothetical protein